MAAVLAHGDGAVLSHRSAAALWEVLADTAHRTEVTVPTAGGRAARDRVRVHRSPTLRPDEVTIRKRIPVTTPARTVLDLAATLAPRQLERLLDQVEVERLTDYHALGAIAIAHPRHHGSHRLRAMLATHLAGTTVDFLFPDRRLIVEIDSWKYHRTPARFDADRRRDATHLAAGHRTLRFTDRQLDDEPNAVAQTTRSALHRRDVA